MINGVAAAGRRHGMRGVSLREALCLNAERTRILDAMKEVEGSGTLDAIPAGEDPKDWGYKWVSRGGQETGRRRVQRWRPLSRTRAENRLKERWAKHDEARNRAWEAAGRPRPADWRPQCPPYDDGSRCACRRVWRHVPVRLFAKHYQHFRSKRTASRSCAACSLTPAECSCNVM